MQDQIIQDFTQAGYINADAAQNAGGSNSGMTLNGLASLFGAIGTVVGQTYRTITVPTSKIPAPSTLPSSASVSTQNFLQQNGVVIFLAIAGVVVYLVVRK